MLYKHCLAVQMLINAQNYITSLFPTVFFGIRKAYWIDVACRKTVPGR